MFVRIMSIVIGIGATLGHLFGGLILTETILFIIFAILLNIFLVLWDIKEKIIGNVKEEEEDK